MKQVLLVVAKIPFVVLLLYAAIFYLRLGLVLPIAWAAGLALAILVTKPEWTRSRYRYLALAGVSILYLASVWAVWGTFVGRKAEQAFWMTWENKGTNNEYRASHVVLEFVDFPQHHVGIFSSDLADYLQRGPRDRVRVKFEVKSSFGCFDGFRETQIGELTHWNSAFEYAGVRGPDDPSPWRTDPWWCP
jgi:hypothetical protein